MEFFEDFKDTVLKKLTATHGEELEISANLTTSHQLDLLTMKTVYSDAGLRSRYVRMTTESLLRATISQGAQGRRDLVEVGKSDRPFDGSGGQT